MGAARYDQDGAEDAPSPDTSAVKAAAAAMRARFMDSRGHECPQGYALDFGVLADGRTALVEANDGWSLGLYGGSRSITPSTYLQLLWDRWQQICEA